MFRVTVVRSLPRSSKALQSLPLISSFGRKAHGLTHKTQRLPNHVFHRCINTYFANSAQAASVLAAANPAENQAPVISSASTDEVPIISQNGNQVAIGWDTRTWSRFHNIWLRDHCRCPKCFHPITKQRLFNTFDIPKDIMPLSVEAKSAGLQVTWPSQDSHVSLYPWSWLQTNSYDPPLAKADTTEKILWGSKIQKSPPTVSYADVMAGDDQGLYKWLTNVDTFGFSFVTDVPATPEATEELSTRIGFIHGKFWDFTSDLAKGDTAYTTLALGAHTDNTYFASSLAYAHSHLIDLPFGRLTHHTNGTGGATLLVDGFYVASILKELHPEAYELLSKIPVPAHAAGEPTALYRASPVSGYPVLGHDSVTGELAQVRWNNDDRSVMNHLPAELVEKWYDAIRAWNSCLTSADSEYWVQLRPGTAVVVDNHRVLHGRSAFDGKRRMCGAYIGVDEYRSKLAVLSERFAPDSVLQATKQLEDTVFNGRSIWNSAL
ncbi:hypothetical protein CVT24_009331 [Panaeolus cyanescens]|uniref:trimethyllysine dioxygenase n=1 Tax=Panaeolus cyanescens TaxID=181874 RepID=A0A409Y899_9AGAR|nr:hypothetical protein CVT24_009331 [Panaeolus cyanescens]